MRSVSFDKLNREIRRKKRGSVAVPVVQDRGGYIVTHPTKGPRRISEKRIALRSTNVVVDGQKAGEVAARRAFHMHKTVEAIRAGIRQQEGFGS